MVEYHKLFKQLSLPIKIIFIVRKTVISIFLLRFGNREFSPVQVCVCTALHINQLTSLNLIYEC